MDKLYRAFVYYSTTDARGRALRKRGEVIVMAPGPDQAIALACAALAGSAGPSGFAISPEPDFASSAAEIATGVVIL